MPRRWRLLKLNPKKTPIEIRDHEATTAALAALR